MKYRFLSFILMIFFVSGSFGVFAYTDKIPGVDVDYAGLKSDLPVVVKQDKTPSFLVYKVKRKNTLHYIAKRFGVEIEDILRYNPEARNGIKAGQKLRIPDKATLLEDARKSQQEKEAEKLLEQGIVHKVVGGETLYSISKKYNCTITSIQQLNPAVRQGLRIGMELKIPVGEQAGQATGDQQKEGYFIHLVESGETFWRLEKTYQVSREELEDLNPSLQNGLQAGLKIRIPLRNVPEIQVIPTNEQAFEKYEVSRGETLYRISKRFDVKIPELKRVNPVLNYRSLIAGETILIPKMQAVVPEKPAESEIVVQEPVTVPAAHPDYSVKILNEQVLLNCQPDSMAKFKKYDVGVLLPLYLNANDTVNRVRVTFDEMLQDSALMSRIKDASELPVDSFRQRTDKIVYARSENFIHFYEGVLLAVDSLKRAGMHVDVHVFDTNQSKAVIDSLIQLDVFRELDLIIGPVFPELQSTVSDFAYKNRIPMVSPLSASGTFETKNPYYFKVNPSKELLIRKTADYITEEYFDKNLIVLQMGEYKHLPEAELVDLCREKFFFSGYNNQTQQVLFHEYNFPVEGYWGLTRILSKDQENVFLIPSETEAQVSVAITNLNALAEDYPVTLVGLSNFQRYKSIQTEYFHHTNLNLLSPYFVDYKSKEVNQFILKFRRDFAAEPNQFSFQGYDVAFYFMSALYNYGNDFIDCLPAMHVNLTQCDFNFDKVSRYGGYMNQGLFILNYGHDYRVTSPGIVGKPNAYLPGE